MTKPPLNVEAIAHGLGFPEGPLALSDSSVLVCDIQGGRVLRINGNGTQVLADTGGGPNGLALGPDGFIYVANNGGSMRWRHDDGILLSDGFQDHGFDSRIERIDLPSGTIERVLDQIDGRPFQAIDDLVFDADGGLWFTDLGRDADRSRTYGGIYWSPPDRSITREVAYPLVTGANGIGLSPDGRTLYATEYGSGRLWTWKVEAPGTLTKSGRRDHGGQLLWQAPDGQLLDSIGISPMGNVVIATQPDGGFWVISPSGEALRWLPMPDAFPTNVCFDPNNPTQAYATLSSTGRLVRFRWPQNL